MYVRRVLAIVFALSLVAISCSDDEPETATTTTEQATTSEQATTTEQVADDTSSTTAASGPVFSDEGRSLDAPDAEIVVDGDAADWADVDGLSMTLHAISDEDFESKEALVKVAHDGDNIYLLLEVEDDYDWDPDDPHFSASSAVQWAVEEGAGEAMGSTDADRETSLGLVDIWHWELECAAGEDSGGAVADAGADNDPGNDSGCNFDDEYATQTEERHDDGGDGAENSLLGVWQHTSTTTDEAGTWTFEIMRPLQTGDAQDAQFEVGSSTLMALAYWDADTGPDGWEDEFHVVSSNQGWITVNLTGDAGGGDGGSASGPVFSDEGRSLDAPDAEIVVDGDAADWADVDGLSMTLHAISDEDFESKEALVKVAHDGDNIYLLLEVEDDYDWDPDDPHFSASSAVQWAVEEGAGEAMGSTDADRETSLGLVDIWHWELECAAGEDSGGAVADAGADNDPGNDSGCNFDDEYATQTEERHDDDGDGAENSLLGVWQHTSTTTDEAGTWTFEIMRPLHTHDAQDTDFEVGSSALMALAYWDADGGPDGWEDEFHVVSANQGWITVNFL